MRTIRRNLGKSAVALVISMSAMPNLVNAQGQSLTSVNKTKSSNRAALKDSVKDTRIGTARLIEIILKTGADGNIDKNLAPVIGLEKPSPMKTQDVVTTRDSNGVEQRGCYVIYENTETTAPADNVKRPVCFYIIKFKRSGLDRQTRYFRVGLDGKLEKVVLSQSKADETGKVVRGSGVKFDQDIDSPEVKKTFEAEMKFWLKDWLKKEQKAAKTPVNAAAAAPASAPL